MSSWDWKLTNKRSLFRYQYIALHVQTGYWVRSVAHENLLTKLLCRSHTVRHCVSERIYSAADVLHIENENVNAFQHRLGRLSRFTVKRIHRKARFAVHAVICLDHVVLDITAYPVLRPEEGGQIHFITLVKEICRVSKLVVHGGLITDETDSCGTQEPNAYLKNHLKSEPYVIFS